MKNQNLCMNLLDNISWSCQLEGPKMLKILVLHWFTISLPSYCLPQAWSYTWVTTTIDAQWWSLVNHSNIQTRLKLFHVKLPCKPFTLLSGPITANNFAHSYVESTNTSTMWASIWIDKGPTFTWIEMQVISQNFDIAAEQLSIATLVWKFFRTKFCHFLFL